MSSSQGTHWRGKGMRFMSKAASHLPAISITGSNEMNSYNKIPSMASAKTRTPSIHLISGADSTSESHAQALHHEVINILQEDFHVRVSNKKGRRSQTSSTKDTIPTRPKSPRHCIVSKSDVCVYVFTKATLEDVKCFKQLCTAIALKIPLVYVRHHTEELPKTFAECIHTNSHGCVSLAEYIEKYVVNESEAPTHIVQGRKTIRPNNRLAPLAVRWRPTSASELNVRGVDIINKCKRKQTSDHDSDLLLYFIDNFQRAVVFEDTDRLGYSDKLKRCIYQAVGIRHSTKSAFYGSSFARTGSDSRANSLVKSANNGKNANLNDRRKSEQVKDDQLLRVPEAEVAISTREWGSSGSVSAPPNDDPGKDGRFSYDFRMVSPLPLEEKATTYLIFQNKLPTSRIRRINYPVEIEELQDDCDDLDLSDDMDPGGSPIHIQDIDLARDAREVNNIIDTPDSDL